MHISGLPFELSNCFRKTFLMPAIYLLISHHSNVHYFSKFTIFDCSLHFPFLFPKMKKIRDTCIYHLNMRLLISLSIIHHFGKSSFTRLFNIRRFRQTTVHAFSLHFTFSNCFFRNNKTFIISSIHHSIIRLQVYNLVIRYFTIYHI